LKIDREAPIHISNQDQYLSKSLSIQINLELESSLRCGDSIAAVSIDIDCAQNLKIPIIAAISGEGRLETYLYNHGNCYKHPQNGRSSPPQSTSKHPKTYKAVSRIEKLPCTSGSDPKFISRSVA
jgi:hypothetical protein